jgi:hypothetical protein
MLLNVPLDTIDQWHQERRTRPALAGRPITATPTTGMTAKADSESASRSPGRCFGSDLLMSPQSGDQQDQGDDLGNYYSRNQYRQ